jgi:hypothetical protein
MLVALPYLAMNSRQENLLLAYLNSSLVSALAHDINPTINFQIGDLKRLPLAAFCSTAWHKS